MVLLRSRLTVMERIAFARGLDSHLASEFERFRDDTKIQLAASGNE